MNKSKKQINPIYYVTFDGLDFAQQVDAFNRGFAPAVSLDLAPDITDFQEYGWVLDTDDGFVHLNHKPIQGFGSSEPLCLSPDEYEFSYETLHLFWSNDLAEARRLGEFD